MNNKKEKKIALIGQYSKPISGSLLINKFVFKILLEEKFNVSIIDTNLNNTIETLGKIKFKKIYFLFLSYLKMAKAIFNCNLFYIVPGHTLIGLIRFLPLVIFILIFKKKLFIHHHGYGIYKILSKSKFLSFFILNQKIYHIVLTNDLKQKFLKINNKLKIRIINNFSELEVYKKKKNDDNLNIIYLSNLLESKGYKIFLKASKLLVNYNFHLCGKINNDSVGFISLYKNQKNLTIHNEVNLKKKMSLLKKADILVLQTDYETEGVPLCILEAMSQSCAIITTRHHGIPETVGDAGCFVAKKSLSDLVNMIESLAQDKEKLKYFQKKSYENYLNHFSRQNFKNSLLKYFNQV